jgi:hypothetical protein
MISSSIYFVPNDTVDEGVIYLFENACGPGLRRDISNPASVLFQYPIEKWNSSFRAIRIWSLEILSLDEAGMATKTV